MQIIWKELKHSVDVWSVRGSFCVWILVSFSWFWMTLSQQPIRKVSFWIEKCAPFATCDKDQSCAYFCDTRISTIHMIFFYHFVWLTDKKGLRYHQEFVCDFVFALWIIYEFIIYYVKCYFFPLSDCCFWCSILNSLSIFPAYFVIVNCECRFFSLCVHRAFCALNIEQWYQFWTGANAIRTKQTVNFLIKIQLKQSQAKR